MMFIDHSESSLRVSPGFLFKTTSLLTSIHLGNVLSLVIVFKMRGMPLCTSSLPCSTFRMSSEVRCQQIALFVDAFRTTWSASSSERVIRLPSTSYLCLWSEPSTNSFWYLLWRAALICYEYGITSAGSLESGRVPSETLLLFSLFRLEVFT